ncbi:hypothetical protein EG240_15210 [Paenimyroides tangerinum]|uniref:LysM domain-containing protein n=1 Tax=Paenimyroides tangerinum TaxID=2488728 RepID=A0A3P3VX49_9FLAO|nr:hypothetical protein [Paenimyroides tangerinum]RRJ87371.1 hypothetical protein EG240_15210 [Paenimyroides tangerinum]
MSEFFIYKIQKGDLLSNIAKRIGMHAVDLEFFHNSKCGTSGKIYFDNLIGLSYLFIPVNYQSEEQKRKLLINERLNSPFNKNFFFPIYHIKEIINTFSTPEIEISYDLNLIFNDERSNKIVAFKRDNFKKSNQKIDSKMSNLALKTTQSIEPISFVTKQNGTIDHIYKPNELLLRFLDKKEKIQDFYIGVATEKYLENFENDLKNEEKFSKTIIGSVLIKTLFPNLDWFHKNEPWNEMIVFYPNSFPIEVICQAQYNHNDKNQVVTTIEGKSERKNFSDIISGKEISESYDFNCHTEITLEYITQKTTKKILAANCTLKIIKEKEIAYSHVLSLTTTL